MSDTSNNQTGPNSQEEAKLTPVNKPKKTGRLFEKGNTIGAAGRPQGSRNKATIALQQLLDDQGELVIQKVLEMALAGDGNCLKLALDRLVPPTRERRVNLTLPKVTTAADTTAAISAVLEAVATGTLTPGEGQSIAGLLEQHRKNFETLELERRLAALEVKREK